MFTDLLRLSVEPPGDDGPPFLHLFGGPVVTRGSVRIEVPEGCKRLLVFVALHRGLVGRRHAAGRLWPVVDDARATGNLRSALWRLNRADLRLVWSDKHGLRMRDEVVIDVDVVSAWAARLIAGAPSDHDLTVMPVGIDAIDLLPDVYDDWALLERERIRQRILHALEALSRELARRGRSAEAVEAAMTSVAADPLRESANRALIEAHLSEGNWNEARRSYGAYRSVLARELGLRPAADIAAMVDRPDAQPPPRRDPSTRLVRSPFPHDAPAAADGHGRVAEPVTGEPAGERPRVGSSHRLARSPD